MDTAIFLSPSEAVIRLEKIICRLDRRIGETIKPEELAAGACLLALAAQRKFLICQNDSVLSSMVLWGDKTGFPSHPSFTADAASFAKTLPAEVFCSEGQKAEGRESFAELKAILGSFSAWTVLKKEELPCWCGGSKRIVNIEVMANVALKAVDAGLSARLLIGIRTDDQNHFQKHYSSSRLSRAIDDILIIFECENRIILNGENVLVEVVELKFSDEFSLTNFTEMLRRLILTFIRDNITEREDAQPP